jgi:hypothetical protein
MMAEYCYHDDVIRTQISLSERQMEALRQLARQRNVSMAQLLREAIDTLLAAPSPDVRERARAAVGKHRSGVPNNSFARDHDDLLAEDFMS